MTTAQAIATATLIPAGGLSHKGVWTGRVLTGLGGSFLVVDGVMKLFKPPVVVEATVQLGYPVSTIIGIGITLLACTVLYLIPCTSILGAVLLTGYLGGAVATNVRAEQPLFNIVFPVIVGGIVWSGLWLRNTRVQHVFGFKDNA